jgi:hypothetical protein
MEKLKELKDDALVNVIVNKTYYYMVKSELFKSVEKLINQSPELAKDLENILKKDFAKLSEEEKTIYTLSLLVAEIERVAEKEKLYKEYDVKDLNKD